MRLSVSACRDAAVLVLITALAPIAAGAAGAGRPAGEVDLFGPTDTPAMSRVEPATPTGERSNYAIPGEISFVVPRGICENGSAPIQVYATPQPDQPEARP